MTGVELVAAALAAGASAGLTDSVSAAVNDAYSALRAAMARRLGVSGQSLEAVETAPGVWSTDAVAASGVADDEDVLAAAREVLRLSGQPVIDLRDAKGVQVGDHNTQHNTF